MSFNKNRAREIITALHGQWFGSYGLARCPVHKDNRPSLSLSDGKDGRLLACCHAGCSFDDIIHELRCIGLIDGAGLHYGRNLIEPEVLKEHSISKQAMKTSGLEDETSARKTEAARKLWNEALPIDGTLAARYLHGRGIDCALPDSLRFHCNCRHPSGSYYPAMIARVDGCDAFAVHRTYLSPDGRKANVVPAKAMLGRVAGGAVRLAKWRGNRLVICEGIETGLSLACGLLLEPANIWAALSTSGMKALKLPKQIGQLTVAFDGDRAGQIAGTALARNAKAHGWTVKVSQPPDGYDFNDLLVDYRKGGAA